MDGPRLARKKLAADVDGLLAVMCPACFCGAWPLAPMGVRGLGPHQILGFEALLFSRFPRPVGATDYSITLFALQASGGKSRLLTRK